jgi:hypothetical protein
VGCYRLMQRTIAARPSAPAAPPTIAGSMFPASARFSEFIFWAVDLICSGGAQRKRFVMTAAGGSSEDKASRPAKTLFGTKNQYYMYACNKKCAEISSNCGLFNLDALSLPLQSGHSPPSAPCRRHACVLISLLPRTTSSAHTPRPRPWSLQNKRLPTLPSLVQVAKPSFSPLAPLHASEIAQRTSLHAARCGPTCCPPSHTPMCQAHAFVQALKSQSSQIIECLKKLIWPMLIWNWSVCCPARLRVWVTWTAAMMQTLESSFCS